MMQYICWVLCLNSITVTIGIAIILLFWKRAESTFTVRAWKSICIFMLIRLLVIVPGFGEISLSPDKQAQEITEDRLPNTETVSSEQIIANADADTKQESPVIVSENTNVVKQAPVPLEENSRKINSETVFAFVLVLYLLVALLRIVYAFISYVVLCRRLGRPDKMINDIRVIELLYDILGEYGIAKKVDVYYSEEISSPFISGYDDPFIILPKADYTLEQYEFIFRHECMHLKKRDMLPKMLLYIAQSFHWLNPFVHIFCRMVNDYLEECCDYYVVEGKDIQYRKAYCYSVLDVLEKSMNKNTGNLVGAVSLNGGKTTMKKRMNRVLSVSVKKNKWLLLIGLYCMTVISALLVGYQQVPDEVKERMESYGKGGQTEVSYCTIEELRNASIEELGHVPHNLKLPDKVDFSGIESIGTPVLKRLEDYDENKEKIAELFEVKEPEWSFVDGYSYGTSNCYVYSGEDAYLRIDENGEISYYDEEECDYDERLRTVERIHLNREECPQMICKLKSGQIPLSEMLEKTQEWVDGCEILQDEFDYELRTVCVKKKPDRTHLVAALFQRMYKGVGLNYLADQDDGYDITACSQVDLNFAEPDKPYYFCNYTPVYIVEENPIDEVIDFQSAVHLVEEKFSRFGRVKVCEIRVEYMICAEQSENENDNIYREVYRAGAVFHTKPVYSFLIKVGKIDDDMERFGISEKEEYVYVNVDMTDGTVITNSVIRNFHH